MLAAQPENRPVPTVLVVEGEVIVRLSIAGYLRECGYRVIEAGGAEEAKALCGADTPIDIVLVDAELPGSANGFALARWIRQERPLTKVLLTAGTAGMAKTAEETCEHGPHLKKPYAHEELARQIRQLLAAR